MAYEAHEWETGEVITADRLNHIEEGIESESEKFIVTFSSNNNNELSADKTLQEIYDAWNGGKRVFGAKYTGIGFAYFPLTEASFAAVTFTYIYGHATNNIVMETFTLSFNTSNVLYKRYELA